MTKRENIVNHQDLDWQETGQGEKFGLKRKQLGTASGAEKLGCSMIQLEPGKTAWPFHYHCANEESIYVLEGEGTMRIGDRNEPVCAGDYISFPIGPQHAHQLKNTGDAPLVYMCFSTMIEPDVMGYPDSGKMGVAAGSAPGGDASKRLHFEFHRSKNAVPYWDGEA